MMIKRTLAVIICLVLLTGCVTAQAGVTSLDKALTRWLESQTDVQFNATLQLKTLMPYNDDTTAMLNGVLKHLSVNARLTQDGENNNTTVQLAMDNTEIMDLTERLQNGAYSLETSLLHNRTLTSAIGSPMDRLTAAEGVTNPITSTAATDTNQGDIVIADGSATETAVGAKTDIPGSENNTATPTADKTSDVNTNSEKVAAAQTADIVPADSGAAQSATDVTEAFSMLDAVTELQACYTALTDGIKPFATEKKASYNIKGIGAGKWSRIARLTVEQSEGLLPQLRALLSCGMNDTFRAEIAQVTFVKGFIVALYQNAESQDICVYLKGNIIYSDGKEHKLVWQWAFTNNGLKRKDMMKFEISRLGGTADTRLITANCTQESRSDLFEIDGKTEVTLKRGKVTDRGIARVSLSGKKTQEGAITCKGDVSQDRVNTLNAVSVKTTESATVDLIFTPAETGTVLSGNITCRKLANKEVQTEFVITLADKLPEVTPSTATNNGAQATVEDTDTDVQTATGEEPVTSLEQITGDLAEDNATQTATDQNTDYLVGSAPTGMKGFKAPMAPTTVDLDSATNDVRDSLLQEAAQNLAAKLLPAIVALPEEDAALLKDGMSDTDYNAFLALIGAL